MIGLDDVRGALREFTQQTGYEPQFREFDLAFSDAFEVARDGSRDADFGRREALRFLVHWYEHCWEFDISSLPIAALEKHRSALWAILRGRERKPAPVWMQAVKP